MYCSVLQCTAVCCSVLQCVVVCCNVLQCVYINDVTSIMSRSSGVMQQCAGPIDISVLQVVAVCCSELQCVYINDVDHVEGLWRPAAMRWAYRYRCVAVGCSLLQ